MRVAPAGRHGAAHRRPATPTPRSPRDLVASTKNQVEHRVVIDVVHDTLLPWCSYLDWEPEPSIVTVANVQHLGTRIEGRLSTPPPNVLELVRALSPDARARRAPRRRRAGADRRGRGRRPRPLRRRRRLGRRGAATARGRSRSAAPSCRPTTAGARLLAGGGIVADSDPLAELAETQAKFQAMLSALIRP